MPIDLSAKNPYAEQIKELLGFYNHPNQRHPAIILNQLRQLGVSSEDISTYNGTPPVQSGANPVPNPKASEPGYTPPAPGQPRNGGGDAKTPDSDQSENLQKFHALASKWDLNDTAIHDALEATSPGNESSNPNALTADKVSNETLKKMGLTRADFTYLLSQRDELNKSGQSTDLTKYFNDVQQSNDHPGKVTGGDRNDFNTLPLPDPTRPGVQQDYETDPHLYDGLINPLAPAPATPTLPGFDFKNPNAAPQATGLDKYTSLAKNWNLNDPTIHDALEATFANSPGAARNPNAIEVSDVSNETLARMGLSRPQYNDMIMQRELLNQGSKNPTDLTTFFPAASNAPKLPTSPSDQMFQDLIGKVGAPSSVDQVQSEVDSQRMKELLGQIDQDTKQQAGSLKSDFLDRGLGGPGQVSDIEASGLGNLGANAVKAKAGARLDFANSELARQKAKEDAVNAAYGVRYNAGVATDAQTTDVAGKGALQSQQLYEDLLKSGQTTGTANTAQQNTRDIALAQILQQQEQERLARAAGKYKSYTPNDNSNSPVDNLLKLVPGFNFNL